MKTRLLNSISEKEKYFELSEMKQANKTSERKPNDRERQIKMLYLLLLLTESLFLLKKDNLKFEKKNEKDERINQ